MDFFGKGIRFPITVSKEGQIVTSDGETLIKESIMVILGTAKGERVMRPDFGCGINELVFAHKTTATTTLLIFHIKEALLKWEPRIEVLDINPIPDEEDENKLNISIDYKIKATNARSNLVYPFFLEASR